MTKVNDVIASVNKAIGAVIGGGAVTLLVGLHVIPASVGNTVLALLGVAAAVLGAFLAPQNKPLPLAEPSDGDVGSGLLQSIADYVPEHAAAAQADTEWPPGTPVKD